MSHGVPFNHRPDHDHPTTLACVLDKLSGAHFWGTLVLLPFWGSLLGSPFWESAVWKPFVHLYWEALFVKAPVSTFPFSELMFFVVC